MSTIMHPTLRYPTPRDTHNGKQAAVICDGVGVRIGINGSKECIRLGMEMMLRVLNPSGKL
jgi:hypothetical protein